MARALPVLPNSAETAGQKAWRRVAPQPLLGAVIFVTALVVLGIAFVTHPITSVNHADTLVVLVLAAGVAASRQWPVRLGTATRLCVASVPLFLLSTLFGPVLATVGVGAGMLTGELLICRRCQNTAGDVGSQVGRWMLLSCGVSSLIHLPLLVNSVWAGLLAGILLWSGDTFTCPVVFSPITGKDPLTTIAMTWRRSWPGEPMQYLIAMLALLLVRADLEVAGVVWVDLVAIVMVVLPIVLLYMYLSGEEDLKRASAFLSEEHGDR